MFNADVLPVLSEGEVSLALQFADLELLELDDFTNSSSGPKVRAHSLSVKWIIVGKTIPLCFGFSHLQNVTTQQLLVL